MVYDKQPDRALVRAAVAGDRDAFAELARRYVRLLYAIAIGRGVDPIGAEDVAQDTLIAAYLRLPQLRSADRFQPWLARIAYREANAASVKQGREAPADVHEILKEEADPSPGQEAFERDTDARALVRSALDTLPETLRLPLAMPYLGDASVDEIGHALSLSRRAVDTRLSRGRERLRTHLREAGDEAWAMELLRTYGIPGAACADLIQRAVEATRSAEPASDLRTATSHWAAAASAGALMTICIVGAVWMWAATSEYVIGSAEGDAIPVRMLATSRAALIQSNRQLAPPREAVRIRRGEEHLDWIPAEPTKNSSPVLAAGGPYRSAPSSAVVDNPYGVYRTFDPAEGVVTIRAWVRPSLGATNFEIALYDAMVTHGHGVTLLTKDERGVWYVPWHRPGKPTRVIGDVRAEHFLEVVYRTWNATWDVYLDDALAAKDATHPYYAGRPVSGLWITSGRGDRGSPSYFDDLQVTARRPTDAERSHTSAANTALHTPPPSPRMRLDASVINGVELSRENPTVRVRPGHQIHGSLTVTLDNALRRGGAFAVIETKTWGDPRRSYRETLVSEQPGVEQYHVEIDRTAPSLPGTHHIIVAGAAETDARYVASGTNWAHGRPVWGDHTDIVAWPAPVLEEAMRHGTVRVPWHDHATGFIDQDVAAVAVRVEVPP